MLSWFIALLAGGAVAYLSYPGGFSRGRAWIPFALRALAVVLLSAALLNAPLGRSGALSPVVLVDVSDSWLRGGGAAYWKAAQDTIRTLSPDTLVLFGDSARAGTLPGTPADAASRLQPALLRAVGSGRAIYLVTDGELDDSRSILDALPAGSRVIVPERETRADLAVTSMDAPRYVTTGDSVAIRVALSAGSGGAGAGNITVLAGDRVLANTAFPESTPYGEQVLVLQGYWSSRENGPVIMRAVVAAAGDGEARNDTLSGIVEASTTPSVVFASTSPDLDARYALSVLRGTLALPARAYLRVAPGQWRLDGPLTRVEDAEVRRNVAEAPVVILHGDTSYFGAPREVTRGALGLFATATDGGDWYPTGAPASPISAALSGVPWDSLPPIEVSPRLPSGQWEGLETRRARQQERRVAITGTESPRRVAVIGAAGLWRWAFKGGVSADAHSALFGSVFDWLVAERSDDRAASPAAIYFRAGAPIRWRRGARSDSVVDVVLTARRAGARPDTLRLHFPGAATSAESPPLAAGIYDIGTTGGAGLLAVNESLERVPRRPLATSTTLEGTPPAGERMRTRQLPFVYVVIVLLLCGEWLIRRRTGLR